MVPFDQHRIVVKFPRNQTEFTFEETPEPIATRFPDAKGKGPFSCLHVTLLGDAKVRVHGFGLPFANVEDAEVEAWVNDNAPIVEGHTLLDILAQRVFHFVIRQSAHDTEKHFHVDRLPPPFKHPYGATPGWDIQKFHTEAGKYKGHQFLPVYR